MMNRTLLLFWILFVFPILAKSQDFGSYDKLSFQESQVYLKEANFVEDLSFSSWNLVYQRMELTVNPSVRYISGSVTSYFKTLTDNLSSLSFDLSDSLVVDSVIFHHEKIDFTHENDKINIPFSVPYEVDTKDSINVFYQGVPSSTGFGAFETRATPEGNPIMWTLSEPYGAMEWWPCKQSLSDKIDSIEIQVTCPAGNKVASNGKLISEITEGEKTTVVWKHRYPVSTYLVAIAITNYSEMKDSLELGNNQQLEILNYVYPEYLETAKTKMKETKGIMNFFNELIGEYPFANEKYGHAQFGWGGGMEHQTMSFMYNLSFGLVAHEMAHQWFGDCITLSSWQDIWLNEGFATYMTGLCYESELEGADWNWDNWKQHQIDVITKYPAGSVFVEDTTDIGRLFSSRLSYSKGAYLLHMLRWELGDNAFFSAIRSYFDDPEVKYGFASQEKWVEHLEAAADTSLTEFFNDWYYGEGYPIYRIEQKENTSVVTISQTTSDESVDFFEMHVPLRVWKDGQSTDVRLHQITNPQTFSLELAPDSIEFDPEHWLISKNAEVIITGVNDLKNSEIKIYPNPANEYLNIQLPDNEKISSVRVMDNFGRELILKKGQTRKIDISSLSKGAYIIRIDFEKNHYTTRFIKTK